MDDRFFSKPVLNSPYKNPARHWELDEEGQPTQKIIKHRRGAEFIIPIPKPKKRKGPAQQFEMVLDEVKGLSTEDQQYDLTSTINTIRSVVGQWRMAPNPNDWKVTHEIGVFVQSAAEHARAQMAVEAAELANKTLDEYVETTPAGIFHYSLCT